MTDSAKQWPADNIVRRNVSELIPYTRNARTHSDTQVAQIAASMKEWGWTNPVLIDEDGGIIAGHGRVLAAQKLNIPDVPTMTATGWSDAKKRAYILADNQLALNAGWDMDMLKLELTELDDLDFDIDLIGFDGDFLANILIDGNEGLTDPDDVPETPDDPVTVEGDVWVMGNHRVVCGDSVNSDVVANLMGGSVADLVLTDPPYGVSYQSNKRTKSKKFEVLDNDDVILDIAPIIQLFSKGWVFVWTSWKVQTTWIDNLSVFGYPSNIVIWHKPGGGIGDLKGTFFTDYEAALVWNRGAHLKGKRIGSVWTVNKDGASTYAHPTQKPTALSVEAIDKTTAPGAIVLDLFGGSGSSLIACEQSGRYCRMAELSNAYCDVIVNRWQQFTGEDAVHEATGETFNAMSQERQTEEAA